MALLCPKWPRPVPSYTAIILSRYGKTANLWCGDASNEVVNLHTEHRLGKGGVISAVAECNGVVLQWQSVDKNKRHSVP